jgi:hypothetical protein
MTRILQNVFETMLFWCVLLRYFKVKYTSFNFFFLFKKKIWKPKTILQRNIYAFHNLYIAWCFNIYVNGIVSHSLCLITKYLVLICISTPVGVRTKLCRKYIHMLSKLQGIIYSFIICLLFWMFFSY